MQNKLTFIQFYPSDHRADPKLKICSLGARGLWIEMICLMNEASQYGYLEMNGLAITPKQLAALVGSHEKEVTNFLNELEINGVFSKNNSGVIYSRRMIKDEKKRKTARKNGLKGGNPSLCKKREILTSDNPRVKTGVKSGFKTQRPDTRDQSPESLVSSVTPEWKKKLLKKLGPNIFKSWIEKLEFENGKVICPSRFFINHIESNYLNDLQSAIGTNKLEFSLKKACNQ